MRILFIADDLYPGFGGQARATEGHIRALAERGHEVVALAGSEDEPTEVPDGVRVERLPSWRLGDSQTRFAHPIVSRIWPLVAWADVIHANTPAATTAVATLIARRLGVPVVMGVHTQLETSTLQAPILGPVLRRLLTTWYRMLFGSADALTAPTAFAAETARVFSSGRIEVVSNGLALSNWLTLEPRKPRRGVRALAYVGRLSPEKRPQDLIDLAAALPEDYRISICGEGPLEAQMRDAIAARGLAGKVEMLGFLSEERKRRLLCTTELFVMPSPAELQSIATLEAMAAGCAVAAVGYDSSAVPRLVSEARAGIVLTVADGAGQAEQVVELMNDEAALATAQANARSYARTHDVARSAARLEELYLDLLRTGAVVPAALGG
jgi:glycosyltransferase involved in cell wall biosynthesis